MNMTTGSESVNISHVFQKIGLCDSIKIEDTLQGSIWRASTTEILSPTTDTVVTKVTNKNKHIQSIAIIDHQIYNIKENILLEQSILKYLTQRKHCPRSIVKFILFFKTNTDYYLIMEDGGSSLFHFVKKVHALIKARKIDIVHWKKVVKVIFKQIIESIEFIHSNHVCHNDISLENFLINDVVVGITDKGQMEFLIDDIQIKLCDFGLAELHTNPKCLSSKHCGKTQYKSPEVIINKRRFDGKKNDIWCTGVALFILSFGCIPWRSARVDDAVFNCVMNGGILDVLKGWRVYSRYTDTDHVIDLLEAIFKYEEDRIELKQIKQHLWFIE